MAVYQGARRPNPLPLGLDALAGGRRAGRAGRAGAADTAASGRSRGAATRVATRGTGAAHAARATRVARAGRSRTRPSSIAIAIVAIVIVFGAAFLSLSQSVRVAATGYDVVRLVSQHDRLDAIQQDLRSDVDRLRSEPAIRKQALDAGLGQLGAPLLVPAR